MCWHVRLPRFFTCEWFLIRSYAPAKLYFKSCRLKFYDWVKFILKLLHSLFIYFQIATIFWSFFVGFIFKLLPSFIVLLYSDIHSLSQPNVDNWPWLYLPEKQLILFNKACAYNKLSLRLISYQIIFVCLFNLSTNK